MLGEAILEYGTVGAFHCNDIFDLKGTCEPDEVHTFECQVDTTESSISFVGDRFPNLLKLKLNNSVIPNIRDVGCQFTNLRFLSLARCGITSLNGISTISQVLEELYLAFNKIDDCSELVGMDSLIIIDLEENDISDLSNIEFLSTCSNLQSLTLAGNPCVDDPESYRAKVRNLLPKLRYLDERRLQPKESRPNPRSARIRNEITYKKVHPSKIVPKEPEESQIAEPEEGKIESKQPEKVKFAPKEPEDNQIKSKETAKNTNDESSNKSQVKETTKTQPDKKTKETNQSGKSHSSNNQLQEPSNVPNEAPNIKSQKKEPTNRPQSRKTKEKAQSSEKVRSSEKVHAKEKGKEKPLKSSSPKKVQIHKPEKPPESPPTFQVTEPPTPPSRVKEPTYENDDEVIITEMLDDMIEDRPPTARGNYESKFFKDSFELKERNKTPIAMKTKPHVITPRVPRGKKQRSVSSVKKLD